MKHRRPAVRLLSLLVSLLLLCGLVPSVSAATTTAPRKVYDIAVAYDNSGSMYDEGSTAKPVPSKRWCYAKYAMEIFASMLDYEAGDKLTIFPMWQVKAGGSTYSDQKPLEVRSKADIDKISDMYTPSPSGTPFSTVETAYKYLSTKSKADEKWLLVLTDGAFNGVTDADDTRADLKKLSSQSIKVQYLGFMGAPTLSADESDGFYAATANSGQELQQKLVRICNQIFQRDELPKDKLSGKTLALDLSMKKLIVFVQGKDAKVTGLKGADGSAVPITMNSGQRRYSEISNGLYKVEVDKTLFGQVVTFGACAKGRYTLEYSGATQIQIFYEPDVTLKVTLTNADGEVVDPNAGEMYAGDYTFTAKVVDKNTGEDVTNSPLMGGNVPIDIALTYSDGKKVKAENGGTLTLEEGQEIDVDVTATYLGKYTLSNHDDPDIFPGKIDIIPAAAPLQIVATVEQTGSWYTLMEHEEWKPIRLEVLLEGQKLTDEQMKALDFTVAIDGDEVPVYKTELLPGESAMNVYIGLDESGSYVEPATGDYTLTATAVTIDEYDRELKATTSADFGIKRIPYWLWLLLVFVIIALVIFILGLPVRPKQFYLYFADTDTSAHYRVRKAITINCSEDYTTPAFSAKTSVSLRLWGRNCIFCRWLSARCMAFYIKDISVDEDGISDLRVNGARINDRATPKLINRRSRFVWDEVDVGTVVGSCRINRNI